MFRSATASISLVLLLGPLACVSKPSAPADANWPTADPETLYTLGLLVGGQLHGIELDDAELDRVGEGVRDAALGNEPRYQLETYGPQVGEFREARLVEIGRRERLASQPFLDEAAKAEGAIVTETGLIFTERVAGTGDAPTYEGEVVLHYEVTRRDGSVYQTTRNRSPKRYPLNRTHRCWQQGLPLIKAGGKARLVCPSWLLYGDRGMPGRVAGGSVLVYEIEVVEVDNPEPTEPATESSGAEG